MQPRDATALLRRVSLRVTGPRLAVLQALHHHPHADADRVASLVRDGLGSVSTQAVYDVLRALTAAELVRRIEPAGSPARYELRRGDDHHHLVCRRCGSITDVSRAPGETPCLQPPQDHGFVIDEAEVTFWGVCPGCATATATVT